MVQQYKIDAVEQIADNFKNSKHLIFTEYKGLSVEQITQLRKKLFEANSELKVVKNRLAKLAYKKLNLSFEDDWFVGPVALVMCKDEDFVKTVSIVHSFAKDNDSLKIKLAFLEEKVFGEDDIATIASLPSKTELIGKLVSLLNSPLSRLVFVLNNIVAKPVRVIKAIADKKQDNS